MAVAKAIRAKDFFIGLTPSQDGAVIIPGPVIRARRFYRILTAHRGRGDLCRATALDAARDVGEIEPDFDAAEM
jgi:hypothetical protein